MLHDGWRLCDMSQGQDQVTPNGVLGLHARVSKAREFDNDMRIGS